MAGGRPSKLDQETCDQIISAILNGAYLETAAPFAGIHVGTLHAWLKKGKEMRAGEKPINTTHDRDLVQFHEAVERALAAAEVRDIQVIDHAAQNGQWQAAAWKLERKHHDRWGRKVAVTDEQGNNFFDGMARAWTQALESDDEDTGPALIEGERVNGSGG